MKDTTKKSLLGRFSLNAVGYGYSQLVTVAVQLLLVPFFLKVWGVGLYAEWLVLTGVPAMLTLLDFGVAQASASKATMESSAGKWSNARRTLQTSFVFSMLVVLVIVAGTFILNKWLDWPAILKLNSIERADAEKIILYTVTGLGMQLLGGPIDGWFRTIDRTALGAFLLANRRAVDVLVSIAVLVTGGSPLQLATMLLIPQVGMLVICVGVAWRLSSQPMFGVSHASWAELKAVFRPAIAHASFPLAQVVTLQGGVQMLNQLADAKVVVAYTMARTLMRLILQIGVVSSYALRPELSRLIGSGQSKEAGRFTLKISQWAFLVCIAGYGFLIVFGPDIVNLWGHGKIIMSRIELAMVGAHALINAAWFIPAAYLLAGNKHKTIAIIYSSSSVFALVFWYAIGGVISPFFAASMLLLIPEVAVLSFLILNIAFRYR